VGGFLMFCIKCGRKAVKNNFCEKCFLETIDLIKQGDFKINVCDCENEMQKIRQKLSEYKIGKMRRIGGGYEIELKKSKKFGELVKRDVKKIKVFVKKRKCDRCVKICGGYNEAVIQLRGRAIKLLNKINKKEIAAVERDKCGIDVKMLNKKYAKKLAKRFKDLKFEVKTSFKLMGMKRGKKIIKDFFSIKDRKGTKRR
jgi:NMD protein affecting ribosome stability and mRNA decay